MLKKNTAQDLIYSNKAQPQSYIVGNAKISYGYGTAGVFYCSISKNKVRLRFFFIGNVEIR